MKNEARAKWHYKGLNRAKSILGIIGLNLAPQLLFQKGIIQAPRAVNPSTKIWRDQRSKLGSHAPVSNALISQ